MVCLVYHGVVGLWAYASNWVCPPHSIHHFPTGWSLNSKPHLCTQLNGCTHKFTHQDFLFSNHHSKLHLCTQWSPHTPTKCFSFPTTSEHWLVTIFQTTTWISIVLSKRFPRQTKASFSLPISNVQLAFSWNSFWHPTRIPSNAFSRYELLYIWRFLLVMITFLLLPV